MKFTVYKRDESSLFDSELRHIVIITKNKVIHTPVYSEDGYPMNARKLKRYLHNRITATPTHNHAGGLCLHVN